MSARRRTALGVVDLLRGHRDRRPCPSDSRSSIGFEVRDAGEDPGDLLGTPEKVDNAKGSSPPC